MAACSLLYGVWRLGPDIRAKKIILDPQRRIFELELELIQTQMAQEPMLRAEVGMRVRCANKASAE